jgi:CelD/BcsL family acetyltransferase involved in cellulose biosynthesis
VTVETYAGIAAVSEEWDELADRAGASPFLRPGWFGAWWRAFGRGSLETVAVRAAGKLAAVMPVVRRGPMFHSPTNWHTPMFGAVGENQESVAELVSSLISRRSSWLDLSFIDSTNPLITAMPRAATSVRGRLISRTVLRSPYLAISGAWDDFEQTLPRKLVAESTRRHKQLAKRGTVEFQFTDGTERLDELLTEGFAIEGSGWKEDAGTAITSRPETERFYREVARWAAARGSLLISFLRLDGKSVAFDLSLLDENSIYDLKGGFDPAYRRFGPGMLLMRETFVRAFDQGFSSFEFLGDTDPYKLAWTDRLRERVRLQAFPPHLVGTAAFIGWEYGRPIAKRTRALVKSRETSC